MAVVADPQGAVLSLYTPAGEWEPASGVFLWDELVTTDVEGRQALLRRGRRLGKPRDGHGQGLHLHHLRLGGEDRAGGM